MQTQDQAQISLSSQFKSKTVPRLNENTKDPTLGSRLNSKILTDTRKKGVLTTKLHILQIKFLKLRSEMRAQLHLLEHSSQTA